MRPVLRPGTVLLRRDAHHLQIGTAPGTGSIFADRAGLTALVRLFDGVRDVETVCDLAIADGAVFDSDPRALIGALHAAGVVLDADIWNVESKLSLRSEGRHLAAQGLTPADVGDRLHRRASTRVEIAAHGDANALARHVVADLERSGIKTSLSPLDAPSLIVVLAGEACSRSVFEVLAHEDLPHLPVYVHEDTVRIGPLVVPGATPCVGCDDHRRAQWDPAWPALVSQFDRPLATPGVEAQSAVSALTLRVAAVAVAEEVLGFCEAQDPHSIGATLTIGPGTRDLVHEPLDFQPSCGCRILAEPNLAPTATIGV